MNTDSTRATGNDFSEKIGSVDAILHDEPGKRYFGIVAKPGVSRWNILSIFLLQFALILVADDYISL